MAQFRTSQEAVEEFVSREGLSFPNIYDPNASIADQYQIDGVPSYVFLDRQGRVAQRLSGARGAETLREVLTTLAEEPGTT